jgi:hypothetical protein
MGVIGVLVITHSTHFRLRLGKSTKARIQSLPLPNTRGDAARLASDKLYLHEVRVCRLVDLLNGFMSRQTFSLDPSVHLIPAIPVSPRSRFTMQSTGSNDRNHRTDDDDHAQMILSFVALSQTALSLRLRKIALSSYRLILIYTLRFVRRGIQRYLDRHCPPLQAGKVTRVCTAVD